MSIVCLTHPPTTTTTTHPRPSLWRRRPSARGAIPLPKSNPVHRRSLSTWRKRRTGIQRAVALLMPRRRTPTHIHTRKLCDRHRGYERGILSACSPKTASYTNRYPLSPPTVSMLSRGNGRRAESHGGMGSGGDAVSGESPSLALYFWQSLPCSQ